MGLFWDLIQQSQIHEQQDKADSLEQRVARLEDELKQTQQLLVKTLETLEKHTGTDIDGDGSIG
jgi:peptidoglycan hydrolase CwlO-like protein